MDHRIAHFQARLAPQVRLVLSNCWIDPSVPSALYPNVELLREETGDIKQDIGTLLSSVLRVGVLAGIAPVHS
jgi:hypothetical protein